MTFEGVADINSDALFHPHLRDDHGFLLDARFEPSDEAVAMQRRADVPPPSPLRRGLVDLPDVLEIEDVPDQVAVPDQRIERPEDPDAAVIRHAALFEEGGDGQVTAG